MEGLERREGGHYKNQKGVIKGLDDSAITPCVLVCVAGSMRCNNHPSDGSVLGCGDLDLMLEDGNTEQNSTSQSRNLQKRRFYKFLCRKTKLQNSLIFQI